jgi:hypothetical protein
MKINELISVKKLADSKKRKRKEKLQIKSSITYIYKFKFNQAISNEKCHECVYLNTLNIGLCLFSASALAQIESNRS